MFTATHPYNAKYPAIPEPEMSLGDSHARELALFPIFCKDPSELGTFWTKNTDEPEKKTMHVV